MSGHHPLFPSPNKEHRERQRAKKFQRLIVPIFHTSQGQDSIGRMSAAFPSQSLGLQACTTMSGVRDAGDGPRPEVTGRGGPAHRLRCGEPRHARLW